MDKTELRREIRARKRAMTEAEIEERSARLARLFFASRAYQNAKTIYGYLPYNQEVRTVPMLERALKDGKKVAVPKVYGDEMKFLYLDDLTAVAKGYAGIPEPIADEPVAHDETALVLMPGLAFDPRGTGLATAAVSTISSWPRSPTIPPWLFAMNFRCCPSWTWKITTFPWTRCSGHKRLLHLRRSYVNCHRHYSCCRHCVRPVPPCGQDLRQAVPQ